MTSPTPRRPIRAAALLVPVLTLSFAAAPAGAEVPEGWSDPDPVSAIQLLTVWVFLPLLVCAVVVLLASLPRLAGAARSARPVTEPEEHDALESGNTEPLALEAEEQTGLDELMEGGEER